MPIQVFVDTNIFLSFYHYTNDELSEIEKLTFLIGNNQIKLFITQQVVDEFNRNREAKLFDALKQINEKFKFGEYPPFCKDFSAYSELTDTIKKAQSLHIQILDYAKTNITKNELRADTLISKLFDSAEILSISDSIYEKATRRIRLGNPPGKNNSHGDAINWEIILENSGVFDDLYIVTNDKDYYSLMNPKDINPFLQIEYNNDMIGNVTCFRSLTSFFKAKFPHINLENEQQKEEIINAIINSSSFASTRKALKRLQLFDTYSSEQIEQVLTAAFNNTQINWILNDEDIKQHIWSFYLKNSEKLDQQFISYFLEKWNLLFSEQSVLKEADDLPF